jgi:hypothetical protein
MIGGNFVLIYLLKFEWIDLHVLVVNLKLEELHVQTLGGKLYLLSSKI